MEVLERHCRFCKVQTTTLFCHECVPPSRLSKNPIHRIKNEDKQIDDTMPSLKHETKPPSKY